MNLSPDTRAMMTLGGLGLLIGIAKLLSGGERIPLKVAIGRSMLSAGLGMAAASLQVVYPEVSIFALCGVACAAASLGTAAIENLFKRVIH